MLATSHQLPALREGCARILQLADESIAGLRQDDVVLEHLEAIGELVRETASLWQQVEQEAMPEARTMLIAVEAKIQEATIEAKAALDRLREQLDQTIQGRKGNQAYLMNSYP